ncbi:MAG: hypothetical protein ACFFCS_11225 [Candidatus Hodarchaeota archaeon]
MVSCSFLSSINLKVNYIKNDILIYKIIYCETGQRVTATDWHGRFLFQRAPPKLYKRGLAGVIRGTMKTAMEGCKGSTPRLQHSGKRLDFFLGDAISLVLPGRVRQAPQVQGEPHSLTNGAPYPAFSQFHFKISISYF